MASVVVDTATEVAKTVIIDKIKECYTFIVEYKDNIGNLEKKYKDLNNHWNRILNTVDREERSLRKRTGLTVDWLEEVDTLMKEDEDLQKLIDKSVRKGKDNCCFGHFQCNLYRRYEMSQLAVIKAQEIDDTLKRRPEDLMLTEPERRSDLQPVPTASVDNLASRKRLMQEILDKLRDDQVHAVGVFGMAAIGKTSLVKEIANKGSKDMFDEIVMVEISEAPNVERIQNEIAEQLDLRLKEKSAELRAKCLYNRLNPQADEHGNTKRSRKLIILDNIWKKLDLSEVGIPKSHKNTKEYCCKLLLTSRERNVCEAMGVSVANALEVSLLNIGEARKLFREKIGEIRDNGEKDREEAKKQDEVEERLLSKCGGLPLAIVALADALMGQNLSTWEHYATELEKPTPKQGSISGVHRQTISILETSYKLMESEDKKRFFFIACLFPLGFSIPIQEMMRYGIGLGLFQHVDNLIEALDQANTWVQQLKSSALLLEDDRNIKHIRIHDMVRTSIISLAQKGEDKIMVDVLPKWLEEETCQKFYAISLMSGSNHSCLNGLHSDKLQILILDGSQPQDQFPNTFFEGMFKLKVLVLKRMDFRESGLPKLNKSLKTLHLEECQLGDLGTGLAELTNLLVLSLRRSSMEVKFPADAIRKLGKLRLLDLTECKFENEGIPALVLSRLSNLEGLYVFDSIEKWENNNNEVESTSGIEANSERDECSFSYASINELNSMSNLKELELEVANLEQLPTNEEDAEFVRNLDRFFISVNTTKYNLEMFHEVRLDWFGKSHSECNRTMMVYKVNVRSMVEKYSFVKALLKRSDRLVLDDCKELEHLGLGQGVKELFIFTCLDDCVECFAWTFLNLEILILTNFLKLERIYPLYPQSQLQDVFSKLRCLGLDGMPELQPYVLPLHLLPPNLTTLQICDCPNLIFLFGKEENGNGNTEMLETNNSYHLPHSLLYLHTLELEDMTKLESMLMLGMEDSDPNSKYSLSLFNPKLLLPSLKRVTIKSIDKVATLWDVGCKENCYISSFCNLTEMDISNCGKLETLLSPSIAAALVQLKKLIIQSCPLLSQVMTNDQELDSDNSKVVKKPAAQMGEQPYSSLFPSLQTLELSKCQNLKGFLLGNRSFSLEFSALKSLEITDCFEMQSFSPGTFKAPTITHVYINGYTYSKQQIDKDINQLIQRHFQIIPKPSEGSIQEMKSGEVSEDEIQEGVLDATRISDEYPDTKILYEFLLRYIVLAPEVMEGNCDDEVACQIILDKMGLQGYQIGKGTIFLRTGQLDELEARRAEVLDNAARKIQRSIRTYLARKDFLLLRKAAIQLQAFCRYRIICKVYEELRREFAALRIQTKFRQHVARKAYLAVRFSAIALQTSVRAMIARNEYRMKKRTNAAIHIQTNTEETKTQEITRLQKALHAMQLQLEELKAMVIKEKDSAKIAIEEAPPVIKEIPALIQNMSKIDSLTA